MVVPLRQWVRSPVRVREFRKLEREIDRVQRFARIGSSVNKLPANTESFMLSPDRYVIKARPSRHGELIVGETRTASGARPYSWKWSGAAAETGEIACLDVTGDKVCDGYRFKPARGSRACNFRPGGQRTLTEVSSVEALGVTPEDPSGGFVLTPIGML